MADSENSKNSKNSKGASYCIVNAPFEFFSST